MKVGMIFECGPRGADKAVCERLARVLDPSIEIESVTLDNKPGLASRCGEATAALLASGCERVVIIWDLFPPWRERGESPCRKTDRAEIHRSLDAAGALSDQVHLVCIEEELEAWLLADGRALSTILSTSTHRVRVRDTKRPERARKPKTQLQRIFQHHSGRPYDDLVHADLIIRNVPDFTKLRRSETFCRFVLKVTGKQLS